MTTSHAIGTVRLVVPQDNGGSPTFLGALGYEDNGKRVVANTIVMIVDIYFPAAYIVLTDMGCGWLFDHEMGVV